MWQQSHRHTHTQIPGRTLPHTVALFLTLTQVHETGKDGTNKQKKEMQEHVNAVCWLEPMLSKKLVFLYS